MEISTVISAMLLTGLGDCLWWLLADARLRGLRHAWLWRTLLALFVLSQLAYVSICLLIPETVRRSAGPVPLGFQAVTYVWHLMVLPTLVLIWLIKSATRRLLRMRKRVRAGAALTHEETGAHRQTRGPTVRTLSRREVLAATAIPPLAAVAIGAAGVIRLDSLRVRPFTLRLPQLPRAFDGMTIAQVSDTHIGKFLHADRLPGIADTVNSLNADFILFTGDLIDADLDDLPLGIDFLRRLKPRAGMAICEGNHDLIEDRGAFERVVRDEGLPLLVGSQMSLPFRGSSIQFLGVPWNAHDPLMDDSVQSIQKQVDPHAFPILLAHHPHSFDAAAAAGLPLTLSGHTHGGQIMLNEQLGAGSIRFRYVSGLYRKANSNLLVCNGIGNWFPIRINAPAEILHITLRTMDA